MPPLRHSVLFLIAAATALSPAGLQAQPPGGRGGVSGAHIHLNSAEPDAAIAFWKNVIGTGIYTNGSVNGVSTLGVTILFDKKAPSGPSAGSAIDHIALKVPDLQTLSERLAKTPYKSFKPKPGEERLMIDGPDGVRIEMIEDSDMYASLEFNHFELASPDPKASLAWYSKNIGGRPGASDDALQLPGAPLTFSQAATVAPTAGRAIDHITFEVRDLAAFCKKLSDNGVKLESEPHPAPELKGNVATLTDPWGTRIELLQKNEQ